MSKPRMNWRQPEPFSQVNVEFSVKIEAAEIAKLKPEQAEALMAGMAKVLTAGKQVTAQPQARTP